NRLEVGTLEAREMVQQAQDENSLWTWLIRGGGFLMMFIGLCLICSPLAVVADLVPFIGDMIRMGTGLISGLVAGAFSLITIAMAWVFYRPVLGVGLLVVAAGGLGAMFFLRKPKPRGGGRGQGKPGKTDAPQAAPAPQPAPAPPPPQALAPSAPPSMMVSRDGEQLGPFTLDDVRSKLQSGEFDATCHTWQEGMANWVPIQETPGLS
ncbi:MAG: TMEM43 family protein, partial [Planctomycetota bacterium]|nr:TMEM43 family protein [Planctomycetota bacterium]